VHAEFIVVDNESDDETAAVAAALNCIVVRASGTPAAARNAGAAMAKGRAMYFLDADCEVTKEWGDALRCVLDAINDGKLHLTGSWVDVPDRCSWIESLWFRPLTRAQHSHVNSANMLIATAAFRELAGFNAALLSGEDADITERAVAGGASVSSAMDLRVIHHGYPRSIGAFFRREVWHGLGDFSEFGRVLRSKAAMVALLWGSLVLAACAFLVIGGAQALWVASGLVATALGLSIAASIAKYGHERPTIILGSALLFNVYFLARFASAFASIASMGERAFSGGRRSSGGN